MQKFMKIIRYLQIMKIIYTKKRKTIEHHKKNQRIIIHNRILDKSHTVSYLPN